MLPTTLAAIIFTSVGRGTSICERNDPADANDPSHIATLFVAFAATDGTPVESNAGKEMKLPPPAPALRPLAKNEAPAISRSCWGVRLRGAAREDAAATDVRLVDRLEIFGRHRAAAFEEPRGLA